ncbi:MAG: L-2-amino-thiazoline-4-carboxylic acid hydrolase [Bradyrhizobium sp.]|uniref:L-2-amino-thiazoline-4-carboxylic acid hydrolase n=1 Tax=Bradyrhizobium sp. TaxID=376 RepID=UPI001DB6A52B|nr:L-2-amino-thiazoline-4-carboxylic acid hydrolase [Bradyrhizobium sp.]MBV9559401.1 L-2-amino-thiazoline-4-carboxylic acid hydrolase [Bradyrhizobium sp.]
MGVLDDYLVAPDITMMDKTRIQAQVLVPVMQALRRELGREKADDLVRGALRDWSKALFAEIGKTVEGSGRRKWAKLQGAFNDVTAQEVEFDIQRQDDTALDIDVTRCRFAEFFRALGEPELGALLVCWGDVDIAEASGGEVRLDRAQTLMQGAPCCTFRYKFEPR